MAVVGLQAGEPLQSIPWIIDSFSQDPADTVGCIRREARKLAYCASSVAQTMELPQTAVGRQNVRTIADSELRMFPLL
jgi:hypothetical protein